MDSITHVVLGACVAEAMVGKAGKRVLLVGALAQSLPDVDFVASFWLSPANDLLAHRGFTHSFLFCFLSAPLLAFLTDRYAIRQAFTVRSWTIFYLAEGLLHVFLDTFNAYGTGWFEPFSHMRISFNALFVADPFLTVPLVATCLFLFFLSKESTRRRMTALVGLAWVAGYLVYALTIKTSVHRTIMTNFEAQHLHVSKYFSTPTPLNTWLWYIVANTDSGSYIGYRSIFDKGDSISFEYFPRSEALLGPIAGRVDLQQLKRFSNGFYIAEKWGDTLVFNDLRFGQMIGWRDPRARFVFHYYLSHPNSNGLVVQRGRFEGWDKEAARSLLRRAMGEHINGRALPGENRK